MPGLIEKKIQCPYCWEKNRVFVEPEEPEQDYEQDCSVCCQPMRLQVRIEPRGECDIVVERES